MNPPESALRLIGPIYDAAADPSLWPEVLTQFAHEAQGTMTGFLIHDMEALLGGNLYVAVNVDPAFQGIRSLLARKECAYATSCECARRRSSGGL